jgi:hypothetical protein
VEAKTFIFLAKDSNLCLEEKRKGFIGVICVSQPASSWLVDSLEEACLSPMKEDFAKAYKEDGKALMVLGGGGGVYVDGVRKGAIWIQEGWNGKRWRRFAGELRLLIATKEKGLDSVDPMVPSSAGLFTGRSFADMICVAFDVEVRKMPELMSSCLLDVLPYSVD